MLFSDLPFRSVTVNAFTGSYHIRNKSGFDKTSITSLTVLCGGIGIATSNDLKHFLRDVIVSLVIFLLSDTIIGLQYLSKSSELQGLEAILIEDIVLENIVPALEAEDASENVNCLLRIPITLSFKLSHKTVSSSRRCRIDVEVINDSLLFDLETSFSILYRS